MGVPAHPANQFEAVNSLMRDLYKVLSINVAYAMSVSR